MYGAVGLCSVCCQQGQGGAVGPPLDRAEATAGIGLVGQAANGVQGFGGKNDNSPGGKAGSGLLKGEAAEFWLWRVVRYQVLRK